jgi:1,4-alpha-glucan branching enzyme
MTPDPWRHRCPNGHASWRRQGTGYYCRECHRQGEDPEFRELVDVAHQEVPA